ncbi:MAG: Transcriptional activator of maltose regulon, MalT, partial [uncultured Chloroflexia bacterium]
MSKLPSSRRGGAGDGVLGPSGFLQTKVMVPRLGLGLLERSVLRERLSAHVQPTLTLISAPAGFGKTTLLSLWCQSVGEQGRAIAWLSLDQADNDPQRFWAYVVRAFEPKHGNVATHDNQLASLHQQPLETAVSTLLNTLTGLPHPVTLVLDDYHVIVEQAIHASLARFVANLPPTVRVVLASRTDPPLQLARLRIRGELMELRAADLCLTVDEIGTFVTNTLHVDLPGQVITALATATEGWIGAIQIAALGLRDQSDPAAIVSDLRGSHHHLVEYFAQEVLQHVPSHVQDLLLHT